MPPSQLFRRVRRLFATYNLIHPHISPVHGFVLLHLDGTDHAIHQEQASMIRRYIIWRNNHAYDERAPAHRRPGKRCLMRHYDILGCGPAILKRAVGSILGSFIPVQGRSPLDARIVSVQSADGGGRR